MTAFRRTYRLLAIKQPASGGYFDEERHNALAITGLRITARVERDLRSTPNTAEVKIYNLAETTRAALEQRPLRVHLEAGYNDDNRLLLVGDLRPGSGTERDGTEVVTTLRLGDGSRAFGEGRVNRSYRPGTPVLSVLRDAARSLGLEIPSELASNAELAAGLPSGEQLVGYASDELTRLLAPYGYSWSIQSGRLQILRDDQPLANVERVIEQATGMLGVPRLKVPQPSRAKQAKKVKRPSVEFSHVLDGSLVPGMRTQIRGADLRGSFKLTKVVHDLDTHGTAWSTNCEGIPL